MNKIEECFVPAPWGNIAIITLGNPKGEPILLVHGGEDSAATFIPLLKLLPDKYFYVGIDLPGHGKSDPFPISVTLLRLHFVEAVKVIADHMRWKHFMFIGHSMGAEIGMYYCAAYPGAIKKIIHLDPGLALQVFFLESYNQYMSLLEVHYEKDWETNKDQRIYSKRRALDGVMKAREVTEDQAEIILSRNLTHIGGDQYKLSWTKSVKFPKPMILPGEYYLELFSKTAPPTLLLAAKIAKMFTIETKKNADKLVADLEKSVEHFYVKMVDGNHDFHLIHPERIVTDICSFLDKDFSKAVSKL